MCHCIEDTGSDTVKAGREAGAFAPLWEAWGWAGTFSDYFEGMCHFSQASSPRRLLQVKKETSPTFPRRLLQVFWFSAVWGGY